MRRRALKVGHIRAEIFLEMITRRIATALGAFALVAGGLSGCGSSASESADSAGRAIAVARVVAIETEMTQALTVNTAALPGLTSEYIAALRESKDSLGADDVKQRLSDQSARLGTACPSCAQSLNAELAQLG